jgi:hypothetical protein
MTAVACGVSRIAGGAGLALHVAGVGAVERASLRAVAAREERAAHEDQKEIADLLGIKHVNGARQQTARHAHSTATAARSRAPGVSLCANQRLPVAERSCAAHTRAPRVEELTTKGNDAADGAPPSRDVSAASLGEKAASCRAKTAS